MLDVTCDLYPHNGIIVQGHNPVFWCFNQLPSFLWPGLQEGPYRLLSSVPGLKLLELLRGHCKRRCIQTTLPTAARLRYILHLIHGSSGPCNTPTKRSTIMISNPILSSCFYLLFFQPLWSLRCLFLRHTLLAHTRACSARTCSPPS